MKIYLQPNGIILAGKAWEIRHSLKQYAKEFQYVSDWLKATKPK